MLRNRAAGHFSKNEDGNVVDQMGTLIVMIFVFAMVLAYAAYGRTVQIRLRIDNACKEALYSMEQQGYLTDEAADALEVSLTAEGVAIASMGETTTEQVAYGDPVLLECDVTFKNPFFLAFNTSSTWFDLTGFSADSQYSVRMSATSKW